MLQHQTVEQDGLLTFEIEMSAYKVFHYAFYFHLVMQFLLLDVPRICNCKILVLWSEILPPNFQLLFKAMLLITEFKKSTQGFRIANSLRRTIANWLLLYCTQISRENLLVGGGGGGAGCKVEFT